MMKGILKAGTGLFLVSIASTVSCSVSEKEAEQLRVTDGLTETVNRLQCEEGSDRINIEHKDGLFTIAINNKKGCMDRNGEIVIPIEYDDLSIYDGIIEVTKYVDGSIENGQIRGYYKITGEEILPCIYRNSGPFSDGLARVWESDDWPSRAGYMNETGEIVIPYEYNSAGDFHDGLASVRKGDRNMFINKEGNVEVLINDLGASWDVHNFHDGIALLYCRDTKKYGFVNKKGKWISEPQWDNAFGFSNGVAWVNTGGYWGLLNTEGKAITEMEYGYPAASWSDGYRVIEKNGQTGFLNTKGEELALGKYDEVNSFSEELAAVKKNGKYGFIDKKGKEVIPCKFEEADSFSNGLALVKESDKYGYIDKEGNLVIPYEFESAHPFLDGLAKVQKNGKQGYINTKGEVIIECKYDWEYYGGGFSEGLAFVKKDGIWGFVDKEGRDTFNGEYYEKLLAQKQEEANRLKAEQECKTDAVKFLYQTFYNNKALTDNSVKVGRYSFGYTDNVKSKFEELGIDSELGYDIKKYLKDHNDFYSPYFTDDLNEILITVTKSLHSIDDFEYMLGWFPEIEEQTPFDLKIENVELESLDKVVIKATENPDWGSSTYVLVKIDGKWYIDDIYNYREGAEFLSNRY